MTDQRHRRAVAGLLAAVYALIALGGESLHRFAPHGDHGVAVHGPASCEADHERCDAHHATGPTEERLAGAARADVPHEGRFHDAHECGLCLLLAQLKVSSRAAHESWSPTPGAHFGPQAGDHAPRLASRLLFEARGPPQVA